MIKPNFITIVFGLFVNPMISKSIYFKFRDPFNFSPHRFEIGNPFIQNRQLEDNFFLLKLYDLSEQDFKKYYNFHLNYFFEKHPNEEEAFFDHVLDIVKVRIDYFKRQDPITSRYAKNMAHARKLEAFLSFMKTVDSWHKTESLESVIVEKDRLIDLLQARINDLETKLKELEKYESAEKIVISKGGWPTFVDLIKQIQNLKLPNENKLTRSQTQSPWYKMIAKYFKHGEKDIPIGTAQNYFPSEKDKDSLKYLHIAETDKLFKIIPKDEK